MAHLDSILRSEYLLSLFDGTRLKPVISADNPYGYTPNNIGVDPTTGSQMLIKADDIFHYDYDLKRSYQLLLLVFTEFLHYICKADIIAGNSINIYKAMYTHLFGKQTSDVQRETNALSNHKVNFKDNLRQNMDVLNQLFTIVEHATDRKYTDKEYLTIKFTDDPRRGHAEIFTATSITFDNYHERIAKIIEFIDNLVESKPSGKIASVIAGATQERCRTFDKYGDCPRKKACIYAHIPSNPPKKPNPDRFKDKKDNKTKTPSTTALTRPAYTVIFKKHRAAVGPGRGVISAFNPEGYDDRQVLHIQQLQINAAYSVMIQSDKSGDASASQDPSLFSTASEPAGQLQMSMLSATPPPIDTDLGEDTEEEEIDKFDKRRTGNKLTADRGPAELTLIMQEIEYVLRSYNLTLTDRGKSLQYKDACVWVYRPLLGWTYRQTLPQRAPRCHLQLGAATRHCTSSLSPSNRLLICDSSVDADHLQHRQRILQR
jgi:hypothetical protein